MGRKFDLSSLMETVSNLDTTAAAPSVQLIPLEDILDEFLCHISDFYEDLNTEQSQVCVQEFAAPDLVDIRKLRTIIGKHVCNKEIDGYIKLVIE